MDVRAIRPAPSPSQAAAIAAALERFARDTAAAAAPAPAVESGWLQTARAEAVAREPLRDHGWPGPNL